MYTYIAEFILLINFFVGVTLGIIISCVSSTLGVLLLWEINQDLKFKFCILSNIGYVLWGVMIIVMKL